jgi:Raf kinase inhibitor-like YbhB/YbcL family protein
MQGGPPDINEILANPPIVTYDRSVANTNGKLTVTSKTLGPDGKIPLINTSYGKSISPEVSWSAGPAGTRSYLLIMEDATAGRDKKGVLHWLAFNIAPSVHNLPEGLPKLPDGWTTGGDDRGPAPQQGAPGAQQAGPGGAQGGPGSLPGSAIKSASGYHGPSAPSGAPPFHYKIQIFAMDRLLDLKAGATRDQVWTAMEGHVLAKGYVEGTFQGPAKK